MAARILLRPSVVSRAAAVGTGAFLFTGTVYAESQEPAKLRKSIYDDTPTPSAPSAPPSAKEPKLASPSPTDRLTEYVASTRLFLHKYAEKGEDAANDALTKSFDMEKSFTSTVASLAPSKTSGEQLMPGLIYVLVSAMGSSILTRNRNILLRASVPLAVGIGAGYYFIPVTMDNVGNLIWEYESKYPALADTHMAVKERVTRFVETGIAHTKMSVGMAEDKVGEVREKVEGWVSQGK